MTSNLLLISTSARAQLVALQSPGGLLERTGVWRRGEPRTLLRTIDELLAEAAATAADLTGIVCDVGPGSFTGIRFGLSTARTLAWALKVPTFAASSLEVMLHEAALDPSSSIALLPSRRGILYVQGGPWQQPRELPEDDLNVSLATGQIRAVVASPAVLSDPKFVAAAEAGRRRGGLALHAQHHPAAASFFAMARTSDALDAVHLLPIYAAVSQPERLWAERAVGGNAELWPNPPPSK